MKIREDENSSSWLRVLDTRGMFWEDEDFESLDEALKNGEIWLSSEIEDRYGEKTTKEKY